ncbi:MAG: WxcM-like domain-containing protein [Candidatus Levybacteria bacterium]|nr:WxcM-like domain-containing protein [Candidatus Levybacteria bacterium]
MNNVFVEPVKKVQTFDHGKKENGWLLEMFKDKDTNQKTEVYMSVAYKGAFKGYHLHRVRAARYVCLRGKMKIITYEREGDRWVRTEHILDAQEPSRLFIPKNVATGLENISAEEGWLVNYPDPPYDPKLKDEQVEYSQEELESGIVK